MNHSRSSIWSQRLIFALIISVFVDVLLVLAGGDLGICALIAPLIGAVVIVASGELLLGFAGVSPVAFLPAAFVTGAAATMMAMLAIVELFGVIAQTAFLIWAAVIAGVFLISPRARSRQPVSTWIDIGATLGQSLLVGYFCRDIAGFLPTAVTGGALPVWTDYYVHGSVIASFGDPLAIAQGNILLAHVHRPFYHYGSFMLSAGMLPSSGLPGLGLALATMLPLGLLTGCFGVYALIAQQSGRTFALVTVLAVACLPDASYYWMQNAFFGFRWLLYTAPGSGYALGVAAMAALCVMHGSREKRYSPSVLGLFLLLSLFMIRIHFFVLLTPALAGTWLFAQWRAPTVRKVQLAGVSFALLLMASAVAIAQLPDLRTIFLPLQYIEGMLGYGIATYSHFFYSVEEITPLAVTLIVGVPLLLIATLGALVVAFPAVTWAWARAGRWEDLDWLPWMLCGAYALLILIGPVLDSDPSELKQRPFILLYALVGAWTFARAIELYGTPVLHKDRQERAVLGAFLVAVIVVIGLAKESKPARPFLARMQGAHRFYGVPIEPGLAKTASFIRSHSEPGDLVIMSGEALRGYIWSSLTELVSLSDVPTYIGRTEFLETQSAASLAIATKRTSEVSGIITAASWSIACHRMRQSGVRWYVEYQRDLPQWDPEKRIAVMRAGDFAVYDAGRIGERDCDALTH